MVGRGPSGEEVVVQDSVQGKKVEMSQSPVRGEAGGGCHTIGEEAGGKRMRKAAGEPESEVRRVLEPRWEGLSGRKECKVR